MTKLLQFFTALAVLNFICLQSVYSEPTLYISSNDLTVLIGETKNLSVTINGPTTVAVTVNLFEESHNLVSISPSSFNIPTNANENYNQIISFYGLNPGRSEILSNSTPGSAVDDSNVFVRIVVAHSSGIMLFSIIVGWIYFVAWSVSFYPQIWMNFKRKSVVGLSFDFLALNIIGHTLYAIFNSSLYWNTYIEDEYFQRYPRGLNPVELNDVVFSIHASIITFLTICQCLIYERAEQRVSNIARGIIGIFAVVILVTIILSAVDVWHWLDFLNTCSYIKLAITLLKYIPQAYLNYQRKSTIGWSIGQIILDFTGGMLSMLQMMLNAYNYNDWRSLFGDPTKFGLGLFSVIFDIVFMIQHYILYRHHSPYQPIPDSDEAEDDPPSNARNSAT